MTSKTHWIIDAGHGGVKNGKYTTSPSKMHKFPDGFEVYEGVINRAIAKLLYNNLHDRCIDFSLVYDDIEDTPLSSRVSIANNLYAKDNRCIYLSIHSNAGGGKGFEVFTSKGKTKSDEYAEVFCKQYITDFPSRSFRSDKTDGDLDKESDFMVLTKTQMPAILVENLFFDNREEAEYLMSPTGQEAIANCLFKAILKIEQT
jgi:N-acetylmuramoyl-L-alanine amidase